MRWTNLQRDGVRLRIGRGLTALMLLCAMIVPTTAMAVVNSATGSYAGTTLDHSAATVTLNRVTGDAVTSVLAEINPGSVTIAPGQALTLSVTPDINLGDSGLNRIEIVVPAGFSNILPTAVTLNGIPVAPGLCPTPAPGTACSSLTGNTLTVSFGSAVTVSGTRVGIAWTADTPTTPGSSTFSVSVDDTSTPAAAQAATAGNADGISTNSNNLDVTVSTGIDPHRSTLIATPPIVVADNTAISRLTVTLLDAGGAPVAGHAVSIVSDRGGVDTLTAAPVTDGNGQTSVTIRSGSIGVSIITATDTTTGALLNQRAEVFFTQGIVLQVGKSANKDQVLVGDVIDYRVALRNLTSNDVMLAHLTDELPPNFVYREGSSRLDGVPMADPPGVRTLSFPIGTIPALVDSNGNGTADPGEPGYHEISYQLIVGAGAVPGTYVNTAYASDICVSCAISNRSEYPVEVTLDPLFDLGTIIGKVFEDKDGDGRQGQDEPGIAGAMVALDDGTYIKTDPHGRYHFPAVKPGQRLLKINLAGLGNGAAATTWEAQVVTVTPGLLAKANFGVITRLEQSSIGRDVEYGIQLDAEGGARPVELLGTVSGQYLLINGQPLQLPGSDIRLQRNHLEEVVQIKGGVLTEPIAFVTLNQTTEPPERWTLTIFDAHGSGIHSITGEGAVPERLNWDGQLESGELLGGGRIYQYQLENRYADGTMVRSPRRMFGVDRSSAIAMNLTGSAFITGSDRLSDAARQTLARAAEILRQYPHEKIVIEGHSDARGSAANNLELSQRRARAALQYLVETEELPAERFVTRWFGEDRPLASNRFEEGRELNRRVEIKGEYEKVERARLLDQFRTAPQIAINGATVPADDFGRFQIRVDDLQGAIEIDLTDEQGKRLKKRVQVPSCSILEPRGLQVYPYGQSDPDNGVSTSTRDQRVDPATTLIRNRLTGRTEPGNFVLLDGSPLAVSADGIFSAPLELRQGINVASLIIRNSEGVTRLADLQMTVQMRDELDGYVIFAEPIPYLTVQMPPTDRPLSSEIFTISGQTARANRVRINGTAVPADAGGNFSHTLTLPQGSSLLSIVVEDAEGHIGRIERQVEVSDSPLFLLAFADGKISQLAASGNLDNAGSGSRKEIVTEGRIALYMKGRIAGRYLLTAALDTGVGEFSDLFKDLDAAETDRLLTNLDPDKLYPVYGDSSTLVYDTESQGKLYLALDSDELHLLVGNYDLALQGDELASYRRTLFGGHIVYRSKAATQYGRAKTEVELFGAEVRQIHVRDEVSATGGSLYYLSRTDVLEGSEQVAILVRDRLTGLPLARLPQEQNSDYSIKYPEGRIIFRRPISTVQSTDRLIDPNLLAGNPVSIQIDYEATAESFEKYAYGGRVRQQLGDQLAVGATAVQDETGAGPYELQGIDAELRLGEATRLRAEYASSSGSDAAVNVSHDGGLNYTPLPVSGIEEGSAWKATAELDLGKWLEQPDLLRALFYHKQIASGFRAAGLSAEKGTQKSGAELLWNPGRFDSLLLRVSQEQRDDRPPFDPARLRSAMLQWRHEGEKWRLLTEYQGFASEAANGSSLSREQLAAVRLESDLTERLTGWIEQQVTLSGNSNNQTTLGLDYRPFDPLSVYASATSGTHGRSAEGGASLLLGKNRLYLTQRLLEEHTSRQSATVFGGENNAGPFDSRLYSEYQLTRSTDGYGNVSLFGAEKKWYYDSGLQLMLGGEMSQAKRSTGESSFYTLATGLSYQYQDLLTLTLRAELREQDGGTTLQQFLTSNRAEGKLSPDFTLIGIYRYSVSDNRSTGLEEAGFTEASIGLAFRPIRHDYFNALARGTHLTDRRPTGTGSSDTLDTVLDTIAVEWSLQITRALEWVEKNAVRWKEETSAGSTYSSRSWLSLHRFNYLFRPAIDAGLEYRCLTETAASGQRQGWLSEFGWRPKKQVRLGVGYNFTDFSDDERSLNNYSVQGWFVRIQGIY